MNVESILKIVGKIAGQKWYQKAEHLIVLIALTYFLRDIKRKGIKKAVFQGVMGVVKRVPVLNSQVDQALKGEVDKSVEMFFKKLPVPDMFSIPAKGVSNEELVKWLHTLEKANVDAKGGRLFAYAYPSGAEHERVVREAHNLFMQHNALNPISFPALRKFEVEVVRMAASMLHGDENVRGSMTSGGSESLLLAVKTYRDLAREKHNITEPEAILCVTAHAVFDKAGHYFGVKMVKVGMRGDLGMDVEATRRAITPNTVLIIASAPQFPHGVVDPIEELGALAVSHGLPLHVDACIGGFMLPWVEQLGYKVPLFDFRVPGVTSMSADVHKYGYSVKGASVILYRNAELRRHQFFACGGWNGGLYISATMQGTRGGGTMAAAWASMLSLGEEGYKGYAKEIMQTATYLRDEISKIPDLFILGDPAMTIIAFGSKRINLFTVCDVMEEQFNWKLERQQNPDCVHLTLTPAHSATRGQFIIDLKYAIKIVEENPSLEKRGTAAMYGMMAKIPDGAVVDDFLLSLMSKVYS